MLLPDDLVKKFRADGYLLVPNFLSTPECDLLNTEIKTLVERMDPSAERPKTFESGEISMHLLDDYFLTSGNKIRFFFESSALDKDGNLKYSKEQSLNKIGHALHWLNDGFRRVTFGEKVKTVAKQLQMVDPKIIHSMYIFKAPNIGSAGENRSKDATYLYCEPSDNVVGMWIALEDADVGNGCLHFIPGSHINEPVQRRLIRSTDKEGRLKMIYTGPSVQYDDDKFVSVPAKKGDLILIDGRVVHRSAANTSDRPRPIYTFHLLDENEAEFSKLNWIQPTPESPFTHLYSNN